MVITEFNPSLLIKSLCTSTPMMMSNPFSFIISDGKLLAIPPSISKNPFISTGFNKVGNDPLARNAKGSDPFSSRTIFPVSASVAIQKNGMGSFLKSVIESIGASK